MLGRKKELDGLSVGNPQGLAQGADRLSIAWGVRIDFHTGAATLNNAAPRATPLAF